MAEHSPAERGQDVRYQYIACQRASAPGCGILLPCRTTAVWSSRTRSGRRVASTAGRGRRRPSRPWLDLTSSRHLGAGDAGRGLDRWTVPAVVASSPLPVGEVDVISIDLHTCLDPWEALDSSNADIAHIGDVLFDMNTGQLQEEIASRFPPVGRRLRARPDRAAAGVAGSQRGGADRRGGPGPPPRRGPTRGVPSRTTRSRARRDRRGVPPGRKSNIGAVVPARVPPLPRRMWTLDPTSTGLDDALARLRERHGLTRAAAP